MHRLSRWLFFTAAFVALAVTAGVLYTRFPSSAVGTQLELDPATEYAVILIHGVGGREEPVLLDIADRFRAGLAAQPAAEVVYYVWSPWSDSRLRSGVHANVIARELGRELASLPKLRHIRLIVHSAGARFPDPLCETYRALAATPAHVEATFIDGHSIRGFLDYQYGNRNFGKCADFAWSIYSNDGNAPGTNEPLDHAFNTDVTAAPGRAASGLTSHYWPLGYFLGEIDDAELRPGLRTHAEYPRGEIVMLGPDSGQSVGPGSD